MRALGASFRTGASAWVSVARAALQRCHLEYSVTVQGPGSTPAQTVVRLAEPSDRDTIYRLRHQVFASELGQHAIRDTGVLHDHVDDHNVYIVAEHGGELLGFVSVTPPAAPSYALERHFRRSAVPIDLRGSFELRLLVIAESARNHGLSEVLLFAALRWSEEHGATRIVGTGYGWVKRFYESLGMEAVGPTAQSGALTLELLSATVCQIMESCRSRIDKVRQRIASGIVDWRLSIPVESARHRLPIEHAHV